MTDRATSQADNIVPPRRGKIIALAVSTVATPYDISTLDMGGAVARQSQIDEIYLTLEADGGAVYLQFSPVTATDLSDTAAISVGGAMAYANTYGAVIPSGSTADFRIKRTTDKFLIVKTATGTATLRFWASSQPAAGAP